MLNIWKNQLKPILRQARSAAIGDDWREQIKPIAWNNILSWVVHTIREDRKFYQHQSRPLSLKRLWSFAFPNLRAPIFIVGAPRSGTTFLGECIGEIPEISYHFEPVLTKAASRYVYLNLWKTKQSQFFFRSVYAWLMRLHLDTDLIFAEKTPQISMIIPFLYATFPDARFIHIVRDGRDSSISLAKKPWYQNEYKGSGARETGGYPFGPKARFWVEPDRKDLFETTNNLHRCMWLWRRYLETITVDTAQLPPCQFYELNYETLVTQPALEAKKILDFLEITENSSRQIFLDTITQRASPTSVGRWKSTLSSSTQQELETEAESMLRHFGYVN